MFEEVEGLEKVSGGTNETLIEFGKWVNYNRAKEYLDSYQVSCPICKNYIVIPNRHDEINFSEYATCSHCEFKGFIRRYNGKIQIQRIP